MAPVVDRDDAPAPAPDPDPGPEPEPAGTPAPLAECETATTPPADDAPEEDLPLAVPEDAPSHPGPRWRSPVHWWPFALYGGLWLALVAATGVVGVRGGYPYLPEDRLFPPLLLASLALLAMAPPLAVMAWMAALRGLTADERGGVFGSALLRSAAVSLAGIVLWWVALLLVDAVRLDRL